MTEFHQLRTHIFICTNERDEGHPRGCCKAKGSETLVKAFKEELKARGLQIGVRAQKAGCLDVCEQGPTLVVYPEGVWYGRVELQDVTEIVEEHLVKGQPVRRLQIKSLAFTKAP